jgi:hypothetical protein
MIRRSHQSTLMSQAEHAARRARPRRNQDQPARSPFTARLTIDVTPDLRARIKIAAFERGVTVAYMLRLLLLKAFPRTKGRGR